MRLNNRLLLISILVTSVLLGGLPARAGQLAEPRLYLPIIQHPQSPAPPPPPPNNEIQNPGFEQGYTGWSFYANIGGSGANSGIIVSSQKRSGVASARLGSLDQNNRVAYIEQYVFVPPDRPLLRFWQWIESDDICPISDPTDYLRVQINQADLVRIDVCEDSDTNGAWQQVSLDLTYQKDKWVTLRFTFRSDEDIASDYYLDDVSFGN